jgi:MFS family permease
MAGDRVAARWHAGPLAVPGFRLLAAGQFTSTIGDYCYAVALPWLVLANHGTAVLLGVVLACYGVPRAALMPVGGMLTDKVGPRRLMLAADLTRGVLVVALAVLAAHRVASLAALGPTAALIGAGEGLFMPASYAILPSLLDPGQLAGGNAVSSAAVQAGSLIGPALGGILVAATRASAAAFAVDAGTFGVSALTLALIPRYPPRAAPAQAPAQAQAPAGRAGPAQPAQPAEGGPPKVMPLLRRSRALQVNLVVVIAANLAIGGMTEVALPALAHAKYGAAGYGALRACLAAGAVAGTLATALTGRLRSPVVFAACVFLVESAAICLVPYFGGEAGAAAALFVMGVGTGLGNTIIVTVLQRRIPQDVLGRVMGVIMLCVFGSFPLSVAVTGVLVRHVGPAPFFPIAGGLVAAAVLFGLTQREFRRFEVTT